MCTNLAVELTPAKADIEFMWTLRQSSLKSWLRCRLGDKESTKCSVPLMKLHCFNAVGQKARSAPNCLRLTDRQRASVLLSSFHFCKQRQNGLPHRTFKLGEQTRQTEGERKGVGADSVGQRRSRGQRSRSADFEEFGSRCFLAASSTAPRHTPTPSAAAAEDAP